MTEVKNNYTIEFVSSIRIFWYITRLYSVNFEKWPYFCVCTFWTYASNFGLKFCSYLKNNIVSKYILSIFIMMWSSTMNFTPLSVKIKFLWSSENGWNISFCGKIVSFFLFWGCFSYIHRQIAIFFFLISENIPQEVYKNGVWSKLPRGVIVKCEPEHGSKTHF